MTNSGGPSFYVQFSIENLNAAIEMLLSMSETVRKTSSAELKSLAQKATRVIKSETPRDSGKLADSTNMLTRNDITYDIYQTATAGGGIGGGRAGTGYFYGRGVRLGTRGGYPIYPNAKKAIYWERKKNSRGLSRPIPYVGEPWTARHPGIQKPVNYVENAIKRLQPAISATSRSMAANIEQGAYKRFRTRSV